MLSATQRSIVLKSESWLSFRDILRDFRLRRLGGVGEMVLDINELCYGDFP